jgi:hypothetical protein
MASAGVIAEALPSARQYNNLDVYGLLLAGFACILLVVEWGLGRPKQLERTEDESRSPAGMSPNPGLHGSGSVSPSEHQGR